MISFSEIITTFRSFLSLAPKKPPRIFVKHFARISRVSVAFPIEYSAVPD